jgi:hypothetical protein
MAAEDIIRAHRSVPPPALNTQIQVIIFSGYLAMAIEPKPTNTKLTTIMEAKVIVR